MKKNVIIGMIILTLLLALGVIIYFYMSPSKDTYQSGWQNTGLGMMQGETRVNLSGYTAEEYVFEEETDDALDVTNQVMITLGDDANVLGSGAKIDGDNLLITGGGEYTISGTLNGSIIISTDKKVQLNLAGVTIKSSSSSAILAKDSKKLIINLVEGTTNTIADSDNYEEDADESAAIFSNDPIIITGSGKLVVTGNYKHAIASDDYIMVRSGKLILSAVKDGLHANDHIGVEGGDITILKTHDGFDCDGGIVIDGGSITASVEDDALHAESTLIVNDGTITIKSASEGIESKKNIIINGGTINVTAKDDGINASYDIEINDGVINCNISAGDGIDSNGYLHLNGGTITTIGAGTPECGIDNDNNEFIITGGTLIATGGDNSIPTESSSTQNSILLGSLSAGSTITIKQGDTEILSYTTTKACQNMLFSSNKLETGKEYAVLIDGKEESAFSISSKVTNVNGTSGVMGAGGMMQNGGGKNNRSRQ